MASKAPVARQVYTLLPVLDLLYVLLYGCKKDTVDSDFFFCVCLSFFPLSAWKIWFPCNLMDKRQAQTMGWLWQNGRHGPWGGGKERHKSWPIR